MFQKLRQTLESLTMESFPPIFLFYGEEAYMSHRAARRVLEKILGENPQKSGHLKIFEDANYDINAVLDSLRTVSMFSDKEIIWLKDPILCDSRRGKKQQEAVLQYLEGKPLDKRALLITYNDKIDGRLKWVKRVNEVGMLFNFPALSPYNIGDPNRDGAFMFVNAAFRQAGKRISAEGFDLLRQRCPNDLWSVMTEVEKLINYTGDQHDVDETMVEEVTPPSRQHLTFDLVDAVAAKKRETALEILRNLLRHGESEIAMLVMLLRHFQSLLAVIALRSIDRNSFEVGDMPYFRFKQSYPQFKKQLDALPKELVSSLPLSHPFPLHKLLSQANYFTEPQIKRAIVELHEMDLRMKTSSVDSRQLLELFILGACDQGGRP